MSFRMLSPAALILSVLLLGCQGLDPRQEAMAGPAGAAEETREAPVSGAPTEPAMEAPAFGTPTEAVREAPASGNTSQVTREVPAAAKPAEVTATPSLAPDLVYSVLVADIAVQRERYPLAYEHYLRAARLSRDARLAELATRAALTMEDEARSGESLQLWLELDGASLAARQLAALFAINAGKPDEALVHLRKIVEVGRKEEGDGYLEAARLLARVKNPSTAVRLMEELAAAEPNRAEAQFAFAIVTASTGDNGLAEQAARRALDLRPRWNEAQVFLVRVLLAAGKKSEAISALAAFLEETPDEVALRTAYARLLVEQEAYTEARQEFERLLKVKPGEPDLLFALGVLALQTKDDAAARGHLEELLASGKRRDDALFYLGQLDEREGNREAALRRYALIRSEHELEAQIRIARIYAEGGDINRSREVIGQLRGQSPSQAESLYLIEAEILREVKRPEEAMGVYDEAVQTFPEDPDLLYARGLFAAQLQRVDILEADMKKILAKEPDHADALNALGYTLADQTDRHAEALGYLKRALELKPEEPAVLDSMGWLQYRLGNNQEALQYLRRAASLLADAEIAAHLGEVLWAEGHRDEARRVWDAALERDPESDYLRRTLERHKGQGL